MISEPQPDQKDFRKRGTAEFWIKATCGLCGTELFTAGDARKYSLYRHGWRNKRRTYGWICPDCNEKIYAPRPGQKKAYIASIAEHVVELYQGGMTIEKIAIEVGVCHNVISRIIKERGISVLRGRRYGKDGLKWTSEKVDELLDLRFGQHKTNTEIGKMYGLSRERVRQIIGNTGYITRKKYQKKLPKDSQRYQVIEWLESMANDPAMADQCWTMPCYVTKAGYGWFRSEGKSVYAHSFAFEYFGGQHDPNTQIRHTCKNKACCNPRHLFVYKIKDKENKK